MVPTMRYGARSPQHRLSSLTFLGEVWAARCRNGAPMPRRGSDRPDGIMQDVESLDGPARTALPLGNQGIWYDARRASQRLLPNGVRLSYYRHANPISKAKGDRHGVDHFQSIEPLRKRLTLPSRTGPGSCDACCERN